MENDQNQRLFACGGFFAAGNNSIIFIIVVIVVDGIVHFLHFVFYYTPNKELIINR